MIRNSIANALGLGAALMLSPATGAPPVNPAPASALRSFGVVVARLPLRFTLNHIYVQASVNGSAPVEFVLDSGSSVCALDEDRAAAMGVEGGTTTHGVGGGESSTVGKLVAGVHYKVGNAEFTADATYVINMTELRRSCGEPIVGILGYDLFEHFAVDVDIAARELVLYEPGTFHYSGDGQEIPLHLRHRLPYVRTLMLTNEKSGAVSATVLVDTGCYSGVVLGSGYVNQHHLWPHNIPSINRPASGLGGKFGQTYVRLRGLQIGRFQVGEIIAGLSRAQHGFFAGRGADGALGIEVLRRFRLIVDFAGGKLVLIPTDSLLDKDEFDMSGMQFSCFGADLDEYRVVVVYPGTPAARAGVQKGDILERVDGVPITSGSMDVVQAALRQDGKNVLLTLRRPGRTVHLTLALKRLL